MSTRNDPAIVARRERFTHLWKAGFSREEIRDLMGYKQLHSVDRMALELGLRERRFPNRARSNAELDERWARVTKLAGQMMTSRDVARQIGLSPEYLRVKARELGITFPADQVAGKRKGPDSFRVAEQTVLSIEGASVGLDLIDYSVITPEQAADWVAALASPMAELNRFHRKMKEKINGQ